MTEERDEIRLILADVHDLIARAQEMLNESKCLSEQLGREAVERESFEQEQAYLDVIGELMQKIEEGTLSPAEMEHYSSVLGAIDAHDLTQELLSGTAH
jgi:hypothetical protein